MKKLLLTIFITTLSFNIFASDLDKKLAGFPANKVKKYKNYRKNFVKWMDKRKANKGNKRFVKQYIKNMKFLTKHYRPLMMADAGIKNSKISDNELVHQLYKSIKFPEAAQAMFDLIDTFTPSEDSALGQALGDREAFEQKLEEATKGPQTSSSSAEEV